MQFVSTTTVEIAKPVTFVQNFSVELVPGGTRLSIDAPLLAEFFQGRRLAKKTVIRMGSGIWAGRTFHCCSFRNFPLVVDYSGGFFDQSGEGVNMVWLMDEEFLQTGQLNLLLPEPLTPNNLEDFFSSAVTTLRDFYLTILRGVKLSVTMVDMEPAERERELEEDYPDPEEEDEQ